MNTLQSGMRYLCEQSRMVSGLAVAYGDGARAHTDYMGAAQEVVREGDAFVPCVRPLDENAIFDLASVTKLFTALSVVLLVQDGRVRLGDRLSEYEPRFTHVGDTTVGDLLTFRAELYTEKRIDAQENRDAAQAVLFDMRHMPSPPLRHYTDMGALALKYVIEAASGMPYYDFLKARVLAPLHMDTTFARVPEALLDRVVCYNYERRIVNGAYTVDTGCLPGLPHDPKARVLMGDTGELCGHAGLFSTMNDMVRLAQGLINDRLFPHETLLEMGTDRTSECPLGEGGRKQYLGYLCYTKHPEQTYSEVPACFGWRTVALNGFTGNHFSVDPEQNQFMIILANRIHNRVTVATGRPDPHDPTLSMQWNDGRTYPVSQNYTYTKDPLLKEPMAELLKSNE